MMRAGTRSWMPALLLAGVAALLVTACAPLAPADRMDDSPLIASLMVEPHSGGADLSLLVTNTSRRPVDVGFRTGQTFDFAVSTADGEEIWRWSADQMFTQALQQARWEGGATHTFRARWEGPADGRTGLTASGWLTSHTHPLEHHSTFELP
jgi:hypothetical protein